MAGFTRKQSHGDPPGATPRPVNQYETSVPIISRCLRALKLVTVGSGAEVVGFGRSSAGRKEDETFKDRLSRHAVVHGSN